MTDALIARTEKIILISESLPRLNELQSIRNELAASVRYEMTIQAHYSAEQNKFDEMSRVHFRKSRVKLLILSTGIFIFLFFLLIIFRK